MNSSNVESVKSTVFQLISPTRLDTKMGETVEMKQTKQNSFNVTRDQFAVINHHVTN